MKDARVHIAPVGFHINRVTEPCIRMRADKIYLLTQSDNDKAKSYLERIEKELSSQNFLSVDKLYVNIWDLYDCISAFKTIFEKETDSNLYVNVSTGSKIVSIASMLSCMIWRATPYYVHLDYGKKDDQKEINDNFMDETVTDIIELPVYKISGPREESLTILEILLKNNGKIKKKKLIETLEGERLIDDGLSPAAKHSRLKALLNPLVNTEDNPLVKVDYVGRQSNVIITEQGRNTLRIFG
jgi:CRISPR locus-related DNA-binding protein